MEFKYIQLQTSLFIVVFFAFNFWGQTQSVLSEDVSNEIDEYIHYTMGKQKIPGLALAIMKNGKVLKKSTYGLASIEFNVPVSDSSCFWLASISKHITATAIMQLFENGIISLDESIQKYLPDVPKSWESITIRHLLTHTSGLPVSGKGNERGTRSASGTYSAKQMYENAKKDSLNFYPGEQFLYSDEGIFLLGYIIHKVSGMSFKEYMQKMILEPSGMQRAYLMDQFKIHPNQVSGYALKNGEIIPDRNSWRLIDTEINAAGGIFTSINDMISWETAMTSTKIISDDSKNKMWTTAKLNNGCETAYGFAWNTQTINGERVIYHPGVAGTQYLRFLNSGLSIIVLTNQADISSSIALGVSTFFDVSSAIPASDFKTDQIVSDIFKGSEISQLTGLFKFISNENYYLGEGYEHQVLFESENDKLFINYPADQKYYDRYQLVKTKNGRIAQLSWYPVFLELTYKMGKDGEDTNSLEVYENYGCGEDVHIGFIKKIGNTNK